ncbi:hypothetical protein AB0D42_22055 [Streptomyces sp. NPDC048304]|uniref:hypothetical protein n=1 Tax=Streptomyces sp. NPDC048304 TaxID=3154820 RepID=UPI00340F2CB3
MRTGMWKGAALGMAAVVVAMLLSGCGGGGTGQEGRTDRALKAILKEYGPRFEQRRTALAAAASRLSKFSPEKGSCDGKLDPRPDFQPFDHKGLVLDSYNRGWLIRGMWITGPQGPMGTNHFKVTSRYGYEPYNGVERDPARRLRKILDVGLHKRDAAVFRVTTYREPGRPGDEAAVVKADVFLADLEKGDIPCRLTASGHPLFVKGHCAFEHPVRRHADLAPIEQRQQTSRHDSQLTQLTAPRGCVLRSGVRAPT